MIIRYSRYSENPTTPTYPLASFNLRTFFFKVTPQAMVIYLPRFSFDADPPPPPCGSYWKGLFNQFSIVLVMGPFAISCVFTLLHLGGKARQGISLGATSQRATGPSRLIGNKHRVGRIETPSSLVPFNRRLIWGNNIPKYIFPAVCLPNVLYS